RYKIVYLKPGHVSLCGNCLPYDDTINKIRIRSFKILKQLIKISRKISNMNSHVT
uniref:Uncharacterized protein n=1 Tax=Ciona intestinalis TaxID=7719 RepID=H2XWU6_CIOIN